MIYQKYIKLTEELHALASEHREVMKAMFCSVRGTSFHCWLSRQDGVAGKGWSCTWISLPKLKITE